RVLARHGGVGLGVPAGVVLVELDVTDALLAELQRALDVVLRDLRATSIADGDTDGAVLGRLPAVFDGDLLGVVARVEDGVEMDAARLAASDQRRDLLLLANLPIDELLDVRMVDVDDDHLGGASRGATALDRAGGSVPDAEEAHQAARTAAPGQRLAFGTDAREVGARARTVLEEPRFTDPQIHDAVLPDEVVVDRLDEARVGLRAAVGIRGAAHLAGLRLAVVVPLRGPGDAVGPVEPGVEPLRAVGRSHLVREHVRHLVVVGARGRLVGEVAVPPAPVRPAPGE